MIVLFTVYFELRARAYIGAISGAPSAVAAAAETATCKGAITL